MQTYRDTCRNRSKEATLYLCTLHNMSYLSYIYIYNYIYKCVCTAHVLVFGRKCRSRVPLITFAWRQKPPGQNQNQNQLLFVPKTKTNTVHIYTSVVGTCRCIYEMKMDEIPLPRKVFSSFLVLEVQAPHGIVKEVGPRQAVLWIFSCGTCGSACNF